MTRVTPGAARPRRDRPGQLPGIRRRRVHLPVGGDHDRAHRPDHARGDELARAGLTGAPGSANDRGRPPVAAPPRPPTATGRAGRPRRRRGGRAARAGRARAAPRIGGARGAWRSRTARPPASRAWPRPPPAPIRGCSRQAAVGLEGVDRGQLAARRGHRPLQVRGLGVEHAVELAAQAARDLARLELEQATRWPRSGPRNVVIDSALFQVTTPWPRRTRHAAGSPTASSRRASSAASSTRARRTRGARGRRRGSASRGRGSGPAATPCGSARPSRAQLERLVGQDERRGGSDRPRGPRDGRGRHWTGASTRRPRAPEPDDEARQAGSRVWTRDPRPAISARRSHGRAASTAASSARSAATRSRSVPDIRLRSTPAQAVRSARASRGRRRWPPSRSHAPMTAVARRAGSWWWAFSGSTSSSRTSRGCRGARSAASAASRARPSQPLGACGVEPVVAPARCPAGAPRRGGRGRRCGPRGRSRRSRRAASRRCRRTRRGRRTPRSPRGSRARASAGSRLVNRLPGPMTMSSASAIARSASSVGWTSSGVTHTRSTRLVLRDPALAGDLGAVVEPRVEREHGARRRHDPAAHREHAVHLAHRLLEVALLELRPGPRAAGCRRRGRRGPPAASPGLARRGRRAATDRSGASTAARRPGSGTGAGGPSAARRRRAPRCSCGCRPTAGIPSSVRSTPDEPPSSATVTTAVRFDVCSLRPRSSVERPVPPPIATTRGPRARNRFW